MKNIFAILAIFVLTLCTSFSTSVVAQEDVMKQAMEGYKNLTTLSAKVTKTVHNEMVTKDVVTKGDFYFKKPAKMVIATNQGKDKLLTDGESFTIVNNGKANTANAKGNSALTPLVNAIKGMTSGNTDTDLSDVADVDMERQGNLMIMTIVPVTKSAADKRKLMFQSFVITVDSKAGELKSIRLNEKGKNYQQYDFSDFKHDVKIDDAVFKK